MELLSEYIYPVTLEKIDSGGHKTRRVYRHHNETFPEGMLIRLRWAVWLGEKTHASHDIGLKLFHYGQMISSFSSLSVNDHDFPRDAESLEVLRTEDDSFDLPIGSRIFRLQMFDPIDTEKDGITFRYPQKAAVRIYGAEKVPA